MEVAGPLGTPLGLAQRKRASPRGDRCDPPWSTQREVEERCHHRRFGRGGVGWITALFHRNAPVRPVLAREGKITAFLGAGELPSAPPFGAQVGRLSVVSTRLLLQAPLSESSCSSFSFTLELGQRGARAPRFSGSSAPGILGRATGRQPRRSPSDFRSPCVPVLQRGFLPIHLSFLQW